MSHIKQVFPKAFGMPEDWTAVLVRVSVPATMFGSGVLKNDLIESWLDRQRISRSDVWFSWTEGEPMRGEETNVLLWFEPQHKSIALLFKMTFGGVQ